MILVCLNFIKIHETPGTWHILSPLGSLRESPGTHCHMGGMENGYPGQGDPLNERLWDARCKNSLYWGQSSLGRYYPIHALSHADLMLDRRVGRGQGTREAVERQRREKLFPTNGSINQRQNQTYLLQRERRLSRSPGLLLNSKPTRNLYWFTFGFLTGSSSSVLRYFLAYVCIFTILKLNTARSLRCGFFAMGKHLNDTLWCCSLVYVKMIWEMKQIW